jgi:glycosyltransferase involved in cell wall biosynthesis
VFNEKKTLPSLLDQVEKSPVGDLAKEIILVDDFSTDGSREMLRDLAKNGKYKIYFQEKNLGKGAALRLGFSKAAGDFVIVQDADLEYDPSEYGEMLLPLLQDSADVVYGSRFMGSRPHRALFFWHYLGNKFLTVFSNIFTNLNLTDMETCYKAFGKKALQKILPDLQSNRFGIEPEITAMVAKNKLRIFEVGISYSGRTYDEGKKINWRDGFSAVWTIVWSKFRFTNFWRDKYKVGLFVLLCFLAIFSIAVLRPGIGGDGVSYAQSIEVLKTGIAPADFLPNRVITTFFGLESVVVLDNFFHNINISWIVLNIFMYIVAGMFFYSLAKKILKDSLAAFLTTLFLVTNYAIIVFGLSYLMDMGGWLFYIISLYFSFNYLQSENEKWLWLSAVSVGVGGLFKEYAFMGYIVLFGLIVFLNRNDWRKMIRKIFMTGLISFVPIVMVNTYSYFFYHYTYFSWLKAQDVYVYKSRIIEYIKSFGSLCTFGWFVFLGGAYYFFKNIGKIFKEKELLFISLVIVSASPVFLWKAITQRILFIAVPAVVLVSGLYIKEMRKRWYVFVPILILYVLATYFMDSVILKVVNLPF